MTAKSSETVDSLKERDSYDLNVIKRELPISSLVRKFMLDSLIGTKVCCIASFRYTKNDMCQRCVVPSSRGFQVGTLTNTHTQKKTFESSWWNKSCSICLPLASMASCMLCLNAWTAVVTSVGSKLAIVWQIPALRESTFLWLVLQASSSSLPPQVVVTGVAVRAVGGLHISWPEVWHSPQQQWLHPLGLVWWCRVLLEYVLPATSHSLHPQRHSILQDLCVDLVVGLEANWEEVRWHHILFWGDHTQHHDGHWLLALEDHWDICSIQEDPPAVLAIVSAVHIEELLIREEPDVATSWLQWRDESTLCSLCTAMRTCLTLKWKDVVTDGSWHSPHTHPLSLG